LTREKLEVLEHFKERLLGTDMTPGFDLEQFIIYRCVVGSRAYGLDNDDSDTERRLIYPGPAQLQWSLFGAPEKFEDNASQSCYLGIAEIPCDGAQGQREHAKEIGADSRRYLT
jgi:hypothetical protein